MVALARRGVAVLAVLVAILAPAALVYQPFQPAHYWRESTFGTLAEFLGPFVQTQPKSQIRLVSIDNETIRRTGPWPWSNDQLTALAGRLQVNGALLVLMDTGAAAPSGALRSWSGASLDQRLKASPALLKSASRAQAKPSAHVLPLLTSDGQTVRPSPVVADALSVARIGAVRVEGVVADGKWAPIAAGIQHIAPIGSALKPWSTTADGSLRLLPADAPTGLSVVSAWKLLSGDAAANRSIKGSIAVVRPVASAAPGAEWRDAQGLAQLLNGATPDRPFWALLAEVVAAALAGAIVSVLMVIGRVRAAAGAAAISLVIAWGASAALFIFKLQLVDPVSVSAFILASLALSGLALVVRRTLGANAAAPAKARPVPVFNGVERREVTALVCEIRDLDTLTEVYHDSPTAMTRLIGKVLGTAAEIVRAHRGTIESIGPSGLKAVFNAPGTDPRHADKAAEAALAVLGRLDPINDSLEKSLANTGAGFTPIQFSIGIETGDAVIGDIGFKARREFSAFGPALDGASTLAALSKTYGPAILVGDKTEELINRTFALLELDLREVKNSNIRSFYALLGNPVLRASPRFKALQEGFRAFHAAYRKGNWEQAGLLLAQCTKLPGVSPKMTSLYEQRLVHLKSAERRDWSGILRSVE